MEHYIYGFWMFLCGILAGRIMRWIDKKFNSGKPNAKP